MAAAPRRRRLPGHRRRVEDEGEDEGGPEALDLLDDDSLTEGSVVTEDHDAADDSDTSNVDEASPTSPNARKAVGNGMARPDRGKPSELADKTVRATVTDTEIMLNGLSLKDSAAPAQEMHFDDLHPSPTKSSAPIVVSSASRPPSQNTPPEPPYERRRREHEEYRRKRDEDPAFVPNRGAFFMHDHRGAGPSANGFRPFSRGGGRGGRGRGGFINQGQGHLPFVNPGQMGNVSDPTTNAPWAHDMHEAVATEPMATSNPRHTQYVFNNGEGPLNGNNSIPRRQPNPQPINRTLSTEKHIGNAQVRVFLPPMKEPLVFSGVAMKQYTKLPDHRPPLRRDKPVRISLPDFPPRYIFPAIDRSFIFIPRAMRPNQQRMRGKPRSVFGSVGGFSRRTSIYGGGGGSFYGSMYSPSIAMSRRSSITHDMGRDYIISPTGSTISRPPLPLDTSRQPVVRLPPTVPFEQQLSPQGPIPHVDAIAPAVYVEGDGSAAAGETSINDLPQPQVHPLPQKPNFQESRPATLPMHQPRPQKAVSVESIESPTMSLNPPQPYQQAFHQQVPVQVSNNLAQDSHHRHPSYPSQHSTGTPLSQIPERAIHAAPFQPNVYSQQPQPQQQGFYGQPPYPMMQPQPGYFYPPAPNFGGTIPPSAAAPVFVPGAQPPPQAQQQPPGMGQPGHGDVGAVSHPNGAAPGNPNLISQEINGTFYFYDASQLPAVSAYPSYGGQPFVPVGMPAMMAPSPDGFFYPPGPAGMMYYHQ